MANTNKKQEENIVDNENLTELSALEPQETTSEESADSDPTTSEIVEIEWEELQHVYDFRQKLIDLENYFANMCLQFEKNKVNLMNQINYGESDLYNMAQALQKDKNVSSEIAYELKLPSSPGEKGYFVRKEQ